MRGLPASLRKDYDEAIRRAPALVPMEAHASKFLVCEKGDPWAAALRMAKHWTIRRQAFGEDDWLLPVRLKNGALGSEDIAFLRTGSFLLLTPPSADQRQVLLVDFSRSIGTETEKTSRKRIVCYLLLHGVNEYTLMHGLNVLIAINGGGIKVSPENGLLFQATNHATTFFINKIVLARDTTDTRLTLTGLFEHFMLSLVKKFWGGSQLVALPSGTAQEMRLALMNEGYHPATIPFQLGGDWSYDWVDDYLNYRLEEENRKAEENIASTSLAAPPREDLAGFATFTDPNPQLHLMTAFEYSQALLLESGSVHTIDDELEGDEEPLVVPPAVRQRNAHYARRSYYKKKRQRRYMEDQRTRLKSENARLREEATMLEDSLRQAKALASWNS
jgi:hypothetical protein